MSTINAFGIAFVILSGYDNYTKQNIIIVSFFLATILQVAANSIILENINDDLVKNKYLNTLKGSYGAIIPFLIGSILYFLAATAE